MDDWQPTMKLREVQNGTFAEHVARTMGEPDSGVRIDDLFMTLAERFALWADTRRIECLYRHLHTGETEWRALPRVEAK